MRRTTLSIILILFFATSFSQETARVNKINGIEVYVLCEPIRAYEVILGEGKSLQWSSLLSGGLINESVATKVTKYVTAVQEKALEENLTFDAIIYTNGKSVSAVKFTEEKTNDNDRIAEVQKIDGIPVFVLNEPLKKHTVEKDKGGGIKWKSLVTAGLVNNSIEEDIQKFVDRFKSYFKKNKIDALHYTNGKECNGIKFIE